MIEPPQERNSLPYATQYSQRASSDEILLSWLSASHFAVGVIQFLLSIPAMKFTGFFGLFLFLQPANGGTPSPAPFIGCCFVIGILFVLGWWAFGVATILSGILIRNRRWRIFSIIVGAFNCINFPFGTALGIFTLIVLLRRSVEDLYRSTARI